MDGSLIKRDDLTICPLEENSVFQGGLDAIEQDIHDCNNRIGRNVLEVAYFINAVYDAKLFEKTHKNIDTWSEEVFGYRKTWTHNCIKVGKMIDCVKDEQGQMHYISCYGNKEHDFKLTHLVELSYLTEGQINDLLSEGKITYDMTVKKVKDVVWDTLHEEEEIKKENKKASKLMGDIVKELKKKTNEEDKVVKEPIEKEIPDLEISSQPEKEPDEEIVYEDTDSVVEIVEDLEDEGVIMYDKDGNEYAIPQDLFETIQDYRI